MMNKIELKGINEPLYKDILPNGLEVYMFPNNKINNFYITFNTKFGSIHTSFKDEKSKKYTTIPNGCAHFLEHLTFKMEDEDANKFFAKIGSDANAYTSFKITCYEVYAANQFKENLEYLLDYVQTPCYNEKIVQDEKGIIIEEAKMTEDQPNTQLYYELFKCLFKSENFRFPVSGTIEDIKNTTLKNINDAYSMFYNPSNMFLIITGNFNPEEALSIIVENQARKEFKGLVKPLIKKAKEPTSIVCDYKEIKTNVEIPKINIGLKIPLKNFDDLKISKSELYNYVSILLNINFGNTSLLLEQLVSGNIITYGIVIQKNITNDYLIINLIAESPYPNRYISLVKETLNNLFVDKDEFSRKKKVVISNYIRISDDIEYMNRCISDDIINYGEYIYNKYDIYNNMSLEIAKKVLRKLKTKNVATVVLLPNDDKDDNINKR